MVKREPTPPIDDDFKYLVINYPYPLHATMTIEEERVELAQWIASCIGKYCLNAIYYKPTASNMVIIEAIKDCPQLNALLGAHKWREFLKRPEPEQIEMESRIYYCRFSTGREVQKYGWRRIDVWDSWFENYDPINGPFVINPYPRASFCEVPPETQVDYGLCRPLPNDVFPRLKPSKKPSVVPGSELYVNIKQTSHQAIAAPAPVKQPARSWANMLSGSNPHKTSGTETARTTSRTSSIGSSSVASPMATRNNTHSVVSPLGLGPPGLSVNPSQVKSAWDDDVPSPVSSSSSSEGVYTLTSGLASTTISDYENRTSPKDTEKSTQIEQDEDPLSGLPARPVDWDKPICPEHKVACRPGICKVMNEIEKKKKRELQAAIWQKQKQEQKSSNGAGDDGDGWETAKSKGRGRGRGNQARGRGARVRKGGWC